MMNCLECREPEASCRCPDGFKVIFFCGRAITQKELDETPTFEEAKKTALREIKNIERIYDEIFRKPEKIRKKKTR